MATKTNVETTTSVTEETPVTSGSSSDYMTYRNENLKLIRCQIANMNPNNISLKGKIYTIGNTKLGTVSKYIPFSGEAAASYHIPYILYKALKRKKFTQVRETLNSKGQPVTETIDLPEFSITELPPLTKEELAELAKKQAMNNSID